MGDYFIDIEGFPVYAWIIFGTCAILVVLGIVLLASRSRQTRYKDMFEINDGRVHKMHDLSFGFDTLHGREAEPEEEPEEENLPVFNQVDPTVQATPVGPYTSWDYKRSGSEKKQEASFAGFVQKTEVPQTPQTAPAVETLRTEMPKAEVPRQTKMETPREEAPKREKTITEESGLQSFFRFGGLFSSKQAEPAASQGLNTEEQLLLLKSHELLLTLTDGLRKVAAAKTDGTRKEKLSELLTAVKLLDAKNEWEEYKNCFDKLRPGFWKKLEKRAGDEEMTPYELRLCALLSLGMSPKEIGEITNRSVRTVETSIYKIRKKLNVDSEEKTQDFLARLNGR